MDGLTRDRSAGGGQCAISAASSTNVTWWVDLGDIRSIKDIRILYRTENRPFCELNLYSDTRLCSFTCNAASFEVENDKNLEVRGFFFPICVNDCTCVLKNDRIAFPLTLKWYVSDLMKIGSYIKCVYTICTSILL